jgi:hypothetical protein
MMKRIQDVSLVAATAVLAIVLAGPLLGSGTADAVDEAVAPTAPAAVPVLDADGFRLSLTLDKETYEPGQTPVVSFRAVRTGEEAAELKARVLVRSLRAELFRSRMPRLPDDVFDAPVGLRLEPGETKTLELPTKVALKPGTENTFEIVLGDKRIVGRYVHLPFPEGEPRRPRLRIEPAPRQIPAIHGAARAEGGEASPVQR